MRSDRCQNLGSSKKTGLFHDVIYISWNLPICGVNSLSRAKSMLHLKKSAPAAFVITVAPVNLGLISVNFIRFPSGEYP